MDPGSFGRKQAGGVCLSCSKRTIPIDNHRINRILRQTKKLVVYPSTMRLSTTFLMLISLEVAQAFGGSNVFGLFRKRLVLLEQIQQKREFLAALKGFAGPHGEPLSGRNAQQDHDREEVRVAPSSGDSAAH